MLLQSKLIIYQQQAEKLVFLGYEYKQKQNVPLKISPLYLKKNKLNQTKCTTEIFFKCHVDHNRGQLVT